MTRKILNLVIVAFILLGGVASFATNIYANSETVTNSEYDNKNTDATVENTTTTEDNAKTPEEVVEPKNKISTVQSKELSDSTVIIDQNSFNIFYVKDDNSFTRPGEPIDLEVGKSTQVRVVFALSASTKEIPGNRFAFRIKTVKHGADSIQISSNLMYSKYTGNADGYGAGVQNDDENYDYVWFVYNDNIIESGEGRGFDFTFTPFANGITTSGAEFVIEAQVFDLVESPKKALTDPITNKLIAQHTTFKWETVNINTESFTSVNNTKIIPNKTFRYTTRPTNTTTSGVTFAEKLTFEDVITVPTDASGYPLILLKAENVLIDQNTVLTPVTEKDGYITKFKITKTIENQSVQNELSNTELVFTLSGAELAIPEIITEYSLAANASSPVFSLVSESNNHVVYPKGVYYDSVTQENTNTPLTLGQVDKPLLNVTFVNTAETGEETNDKNKFVKNIINISGTDTSNTDNTQLAAYENQIVIYQFGHQFINYQKGPLDSLKFTETEGESYKKTEQIPVKLTTGIASVNNTAPSTATLKIQVEYENPANNITKIVPAAELNANTTISIPNGNSVKSIEYLYENVDVNFKITTGPTLSYKVVEQAEDSKHGVKFSNEMTRNYIYSTGDASNTIVTAEEKGSAFFTYKKIDTGTTGRYESNKTAANLATGQYPKEDEVLLFTITAKNRTNAPLELSKIEDSYTSNMSLYSGTKVKDNGDLLTGSILNKYLSAATGNFVLWNPSNLEEVYLDQNVIESITNIEGISPNNGNITIKFKENSIAIQPGETLKLTYTMKMNSQFVEGYALHNRFVATDRSDQNVFQGEFWWGKPTPVDRVGTTTKSWANVSGAQTNEQPYPNDIINFTSTIKNTSDDYWDGEIEMVDTFDEFLVPHQGKSDIPENFNAYDALNEENPFNLGVLNAPVGFDKTQVTVTYIPGTNTFKVNLGDNKLGKNEYVQLVYTMKIAETVEPNQTIINQFLVNYKNTNVGRASCKLIVNLYAKKLGIIDYVKSVQGVPLDGISGETSNIEQLLNGEKAKYTVSVENAQTRSSLAVQYKTLMDSLPNNLKYVDGSAVVKIQEIGVGGNIDEERTLSVDDYTVSYDFSSQVGSEQNTLKIALKNPEILEGQTYKNKVLQKSKKVIITYEAIVDVESSDFPAITENAQRVQRKNYATAFFLEDIYKIRELKSGSVLASDIFLDLDKDPSTQTSLRSAADVYIMNNKKMYGNIYKAVTAADKSTNIQNGKTTRDYTIEVNSYSISTLDIKKIIDILPTYETVDETKGLTLVDNLGNTYDVMYTLDTYQKIGSKDRQKIVVTGYEKNGGITEIALPKIKKMAEPVIFSLKYSTNIDIATATNDMRSVERIDEHPVIGENNEVSMYLDENVDFQLYARSGTTYATKVEENTPEKNWDNDDTTTIRYMNAAAVEITDQYITPYTGIKPFNIITDGTNESYSAFTSAEPGENIAWETVIGNSNYKSAQTIKAGSMVAISLPKGLQYAGYMKNNPSPTYLSEPTITPDGNGGTTVVWTVTEDIPRNVRKVLGIKTTSEYGKYTTYNVKVLFIPLQETTQYFYHKQISETVNSGYIYKDDWKDISQIIPSYTGLTHYVESQNQASVFGTMGISSKLTITDLETNQMVTSKDLGDRTLTLGNRDTKFKYTMTVNADKNPNGAQNLVLINRLPAQNDLTSLGGEHRKSEAAVNLVNDGEFVATIEKLTGGTQVTPLVKDTDYVVEYFIGAITDTFTDADYNGVIDTSRWLAKSEITDFSKVTAVRVRMINPLYTLENNHSLNVSYTAKLVNYSIGKQVANNSFGFGLKIANNGTPLKSEPLVVSVDAPVDFNRVKLVKKLYDTNSNPKQKNFTITLIGKDEITEEEAYRNDYTITTETPFDEDGDSVIDGFIGELSVLDLPKNLVYSATENPGPEFKTPEYDVTHITRIDGTKDYTIVVNNTPLRDISLLKVGEDGLPLAGATFGIWNENQQPTAGTEISRVTSGDTGTIIFENLEIGKYKVMELQAPALYQVDSTIHSVDLTKDDYSIFVGNITNTFIRGSIELKKVDAGGAPLAGATFGVWEAAANPTTDSPLQTVVSDGFGKIAFTNLLLGDYQIKEIEAPAGYMLNDAIHDVTLTTAVTNFDIGNIVNEQLRGSIHLTKVDENNEALAGATFGLWEKTQNPSIDAPLQTLTSTASGDVTFTNLLPNAYLVKELEAPYGYEINDTIYEGIVANDTLTIDLGSIQNVKQTNSLTGFVWKDLNNNHVYDVGEDLLENRKINIYRTADLAASGIITLGDSDIISPVDGVITDNEGRYEFKDLPEDDYTIHIVDINEDEELVDPMFATPDCSSVFYKETRLTESIAVRTDSKIKDVNAGIKAITGTIELVKVDESGQTLENAEFTLWDVNNEAMPLAVSMSDANGKIIFSDLAFGTYIVQETKAPTGYELLVEKQQVTISATNLNINLGQIENKKSATTTSVVPEEETPTLVATGEWIQEMKIFGSFAILLGSLGLMAKKRYRENK